MRLFLLRVLIASWMIPATLIIVTPLIYLMTGNIKLVMRENKELINTMWNGV